MEPGWLTLLQNSWYQRWFGFVERMIIPGLFDYNEKYAENILSFLPDWRQGNLIITEVYVPLEEIDHALTFNASFYLTYHRYARKDQIEKPYL